jgi:hypothetical protein
MDLAWTAVLAAQHPASVDTASAIALGGLPGLGKDMADACWDSTLRACCVVSDDPP